ncbi:diguanylate cyclase [Exiguobacterium sp. SL-10]|uniref:GGDEF domain-containing protein n=1 Tax=unclassified Exiguobacterium TaxID=2644629 RepID=UPI00103A4460|nr:MULTISPECIES: sensor domain-containing diguanylate cyclase [unclassified Exiguobacterium]TCI21428.1 diguanylate cyclase [Exiguobacterium sp. SL-9]TCI29996.1 diguanylate cyclase [Exiguobacterium sp. SL-10]
MLEFGFGLLLGLIFMLTIHKIRQSRKGMDEEFTHFGNRLKDVIYIFEVKPVFRFRYISPSLDFYLGEGVVATNYEDPYDCFRRVHPEDYELLVNKVLGKVDYEKAILQRWRTNDGHYLWFEEYTTPIYENDEIVAVQGVIRNVHAAMTERETLAYESRHDSLTSVLNRRAFNEAVHCLSNGSIGLIVIDLNDLKRINDNHGHSAGDKLLQETAFELLELSTSVYRLGGDEFVILAENQDEEAFVAFTTTIKSKLETKQISAAVGAAWHEQLTDFSQVYEEADHDMYRQKQRNKTKKHVSH